MRRIESDNIHGITYQGARLSSIKSMKNLKRWKDRARDIEASKKNALTNKPFKLTKRKGKRRYKKIPGETLPRIKF